MKRRINSPAQNRLEDRFLFGLMPLIALLLIFLVFSPRHLHPTGALAVALAVFLSLPMIVAIILVGLYLGEETDEFQKSLWVRALLWSIGVSLTATIFWGSLETFVHVPPVSIWSVESLFFAVLGVTSAILRWRHR